MSDVASGRRRLLAYGEKIWIGLANETERAAYDAADAIAPMDALGFVWLKEVDQ